MSTAGAAVVCTGNTDWPRIAAASRAQNWWEPERLTGLPVGLLDSRKPGPAVPGAVGAGASKVAPRDRAWPIISAVKVDARIGIVVVLLGCVAGVVWMFTGSASDRVVGTGSVVGGVAGVLALVVAVAVLWPQIARRRAGAAAVETGQVPAATEYLAEETLRYWREQAKDRRITTPSPAAVRWSWAGEEVAVP